MTTVPLFSTVGVTATVDLASAVQRVMDSHWYILGKEVSEFEREFAEYCGVPYCVGLANGTDALELALRSVGAGEGDRVVLAANAGFYGSTAVRIIGAVPVYTDVDPQTLTLAPTALRKVLEKGVKAIIVTHLYGQLADVTTIVDLAAEFDVPVIEDCAQAHGAARGGRRAGAFGHVGCFSFYPTKNLGALGDGGAVITSRAEIAARVRRLRQYGWGAKYHVEAPGGRNSRLDEIQAAVLRAKLRHLDAWNARRRAVARSYNEAFVELPARFPPSTGEDYVAHLYVLRVANRARFRKVLNERGVASDVHYPVPDHLQPGYPCEDGKGALPVTEAACDSVVSLPCFPGIKDEQVEQVIEAVKLAAQ
ncbi:MAG: DegT/DnrJ/EryC1/StrS family aminotransferase [Gammaproteobacteria bacterium]|nr:DegT/DnrJ/EryC1/StrS family aminotransferase [Gammaproteobacteria bacterium]